MVYAIEFRPAVLKSLKVVPKKDLIRIRKKLEGIAKVLPPQARTKMKGNNSFHKVRAGDYRIVYEIHENRLVILVVKIGHRKDIYERLS